MNSSFISALTAWREALPPVCILPDEAIAGYQKNCLGLARSISAVLQPRSEEEVITIVRIAGQYRTPLYTISTGHNWGYGSAIPVSDDCTIVDLSQMNAIIEMDEDLGLVTLQPGVTQQQLADYLAERKLDFYVPTTGAGPNASLVGNALERGFGMTPDEDHFSAVNSLRAVLADANVYESCFAQMGAKSASVWRWGIGPYVDGLFAQANLGIVTSLQISLVARAQHTEVYIFMVKNENGLKAMTDACRRLMTDMRGTLGNIKILNHAQVQSTTGGQSVGMGITSNFSWLGVGVFRCPKSLVAPIRREVKRILHGCADQILFLNQSRYRLALTLAQIVPGKIGTTLKGQVNRVGYLLNIMNGVPSSLELPLVYLHVKIPDNIPLDPARDGVGIIWYAPVLPLKAQSMLDMTQMIKEVLIKYEFPQTVSYTFIHKKCSIDVIPIVFDRSVHAEIAWACFKELWQRGNALGCPPYRINVEAMQMLTNQPDSPYWQTVAKIKEALDPNNILSPGRYATLKPKLS